MNKDKMIEWIGCHRVGISSRTMWCAIMGVKCYKADVPYDADDFSRCYDLYKFSELTTADLQKVANIYPYWRPIIDQWDELCEMYVAKNYEGVNDRLNSMFDEIMELKGYTKSYTKTRIRYYVKKSTKENQNLYRDRQNLDE